MIFLPFYAWNISVLVDVAAAVIPAIVLLVYIYRKDTIEKEPIGLLIKLLFFGVLAGIFSILLETIGGRILDAMMLDPDSILYSILEAFFVVALVEEGTKFLLLKMGTWRHPAFNFRFDAIVYAVFVSLGFAAFENVIYVFEYGLSVAIPRALLSIPGHMAFAVVAGVFYGRAKMWDAYGNEGSARILRVFAFLAAMFLHGFYDVCLMIGTTGSTILFILYVILMYIFIFRLIRKESETDTPV